jgi:hypothetical protein
MVQFSGVGSLHSEVRRLLQAALEMRGVLQASDVALHLAVRAKVNVWYQAMTLTALIPEVVAVATAARLTFFVRLTREWNIRRLPHVSLVLVQEHAPKNRSAEKRV